MQASRYIAVLFLAAQINAPAAFAETDDPGLLGLLLDSPAPGKLVRLSAPVVEVSGRAAAELYASDIVIVIDLSNSALLASGADVDGDGVLGTTKRWARDGGGRGQAHRRWTTDPDDTIIRSELLAARLLVSGLGARKNRIGVLTYTGIPRVRAPIGSPDAALEAVERIRIVEDWSGTNIALALQRAARMFDETPPLPGPLRPRNILLFSDGEPTVPYSGYMAARRAIEKTRELAERKIRVCTFAFGEDADMEFLSDLARLTLCRLIPFEAPQDLLIDRISKPFELRQLTIVNLTTGQPARAVRILPDGGFDGFAMLVPGKNHLRVSATLTNGRHATAVRTVRYEPAETESEQDRRNAARLLIELRRRTQEVEAAAAEGRQPDREGRLEGEGSNGESP
jgi:hypothetical protein